MVKKLTFLVGAGVGFVLGSKMGHGPYQELEAKVRKLPKQPKVQEALDQVKSAAKQKVSSDPLATSHESAGHEVLSPEELDAELAAPG